MEKTLDFGGNPDHVTLGLCLNGAERYTGYVSPGVCLTVNFAASAGLAEVCALLSDNLVCLSWPLVIRGIQHGVVDETIDQWRDAFVRGK